MTSINKQITKMLNTDKVYDIQFNGLKSSDGWKISIVGKKMNDIYDLYERLNNYLVNHKIAHKVATSKRLESNLPEQNRKLFTIYVPNSMDINKLLLKVEYLLKGYKGWQDIKIPFKGYNVYSGGICFRNDKDDYGNYIPAKNSK